MKALLDRVLEANTQQKAVERFKEHVGDLREEAPDAVDAFQDGPFDATAVLALPEKYHRWLRTTNMLERFIEEIRRRERKGDSDLPQQGVGLASRLCPTGGKTRGVVDQPALP